jgi:thiamine biosynthesis lipoprotein
MTADALATSFMVMGLEEAERFVDAHPSVEAYFIYSDSSGVNKTYFTKGMEKYIK